MLPALVGPSISIEPGSETIAAGASAAFAVAATGTAPLSYQWLRNGGAVAGATSASYVIPAAAAADNGAQFTVVVSNGAGSVTSTAALLTVNSTPGQLSTSTSALSFGTVKTTSNSGLAVTFSNTGGSSVTIANVTIAGPGFTTSGVSSGLILAAGQAATLDVNFTPAAAGTVTGDVVVASNGANSLTSISLSGTGAVSASHSVTLNWSPSTSTVQGYNVYRSTVSGGPYTLLNTSLIPSTQFVDSTVAAGQTYYYVVTSENSSNMQSAYSSEVSAIVPQS